jgi:integrase
LTPRALRDHAMVAMLIGCGLRRAELLALTLDSIQQREEHWVIADLVGKGGHMRTVPIPGWVKAAVDAWTDSANVTHGPVFRAINKAGRVWGNGMSPKVLWDVVRAAAARAGIDKLAPHDLRARARDSVIWRLASWIKSNSSWAMSQSRRQSATLDASSGCDARSTTALESSPTRLERRGEGGRSNPSALGD